MEENTNIVDFEEIPDSELNDIWHALFPQVKEKKEKIQKLDKTTLTKPRRHLKFLTM